MKKCIYCGKSSIKMSNEHIVSKTVLREIFGSPIRNIVKYGDKKFIDHEHTIKDVCITCNSNLSHYDNEGKKIAKLVASHYTALNFKFPYNVLSINWLVKTHLNQLRIIKDIETSTYYKVSDQIYDKIINYEFPSSHLLKIYIEGWEGLDYFWDIKSDKRIQYLSYKSVRFKSQNIIVSNFRFKFIDTFLFLPYLEDYSDFNSRVYSVLEEMRLQHGFNPQKIRLSDKSHRNIIIKNTVSSDNLLNCIHYEPE